MKHNFERSFGRETYRNYSPFQTVRDSSPFLETLRTQRYTPELAKTTSYNKLDFRALKEDPIDSILSKYKEEFKQSYTSRENKSPFVYEKSFPKLDLDSIVNSRDKTPFERKQEELKSSIFDQPRAVTSRPKTPTTNFEYQQPLTPKENYPKARDIKRLNLNQNYMEAPQDKSQLQKIEISGLGPEHDDFYIKSLCKGIHLVELKTQTNFITGKCTGKASLTIRTQPHLQTLKNLELNCIKQGLKFKRVPECFGKKDNYKQLSSRKLLDPGLELNSSRNHTPIKGKPELTTTDNLFGSSPGVGRRYPKTPAVKSSRALQSWNRVQKLESKTPPKVLARQQASYMRPTTSSKNKSAKPVNNY